MQLNALIVAVLAVSLSGRIVLTGAFNSAAVLLRSSRPSITIQSSFDEIEEVKVFPQRRARLRSIRHNARLSTPSSLRAVAIGSVSDGGVTARNIIPSSGVDNYTTRLKRPTMNKSLAFLAGVADVLCFNRHNCYANMMTGNTIKLATSVAELRFVDAAFFALLILSYAIGFGSYRAIDQVVLHQTSAAYAGTNFSAVSGDVSDRPSTPAVVAPAVLAIFVLYDVLCRLSTNATPSRWLMPILALGSAIVNSAAAESTGSVTCMMTGNIQKVASYMADLFLHAFIGGPTPKEGKQAGARKSAKIVLSFISGVGLSTVAVRLYHLSEASCSHGLIPCIIRMMGWTSPFTALGGAYALLLALYNRPVGFVSPRRFLKELTWKVQNNVAECELDKYEADCLRINDGQGDKPRMKS